MIKIRAMVMHANKLSCLWFTDTDGRQETPRLETKDFITHSNISSQNIRVFYLCASSLSPNSNRAKGREAGDYFTCSGQHYKRGTLSLGTQIFYNRK